MAGRFLAFLFILAATVHCFAAPAAFAKAESKIYAVSGNHSLYGSYKGELELRSRPDGKLDVIRVIVYDNFRFEEFRVRQVWTGSGALKDSSLVADFCLKQADFLLSADDTRRTPAQFSQPFHVRYSVDLGGTPNLSLNDPGRTEERLAFSRAGNDLPIWQNERVLFASKGDCFQTVGKLSMRTLFLPVILRLRNSPLYSPYLRRDEYLKGMQYFVFDPSDFRLFQKEKNLLSVNNKVLDSVSLVEASWRADAYSHSLGAKAIIFERDMQENHLNELGLFCGASFDESGKQNGRLANGDGALWSGMYAGSQAMRYLVRREKEALENFKRTTRGLMLLMDLTGDPHEFARTAETMRPGEKLAEPWVQGVSPYTKIKYIRGGNNDMIKGLFQAFAWAYEILPPDDPFLVEVSQHAMRLPALRIASRDKIHPGNLFSASGLAALAAGKSKDLRKYIDFDRFCMAAIDFLNLDKGFYYGGIADWSGVNLSMVSQINEILIAKNLCKKFKASSDQKELEKILCRLRQKLANSWSVYAPARRDFITIAADAFAFSDPELLKFPAGTKATDSNRQSSWAQSRQRALWGLREVPAMPLKHRISFDYRLRPEWCVSAWPLRPWKFYAEKEQGLEYYVQGVHNYPLFEGTAFDTDNYWATAAFRYCAQADPKLRHGRADYLYVYWMGRLSGLIADDW